MASYQSRLYRIDTDRRWVLKAIGLTGALGLASGVASARPTYPDIIPLPDGFQPEGIVTGRGHSFYVGSLADGSIYRGDLRTGEGDVLVTSPTIAPAVGLSHDDRSDSLFVAGGPSGRGAIYDGGTGGEIANFELTDALSTFVNDVVVTSDAAFFTDSFRPVLYRVPLGPAGRVPDPVAPEEISLGGDFVSVAGFNANGIDAPPNEDYLLVVNSSTGSLYRVDPLSGFADDIDLGGATLTAGDGILLDGRTLYVVRNQLDQIAVVRLEPGAGAGGVVDTITDPAFDVPTTVTGFGNGLYAVNARFNRVPDPATAAYDVVRVPKAR